MAVWPWCSREEKNPITLVIINVIRSSSHRYKHGIGYGRHLVVDLVALLWDVAVVVILVLIDDDNTIKPVPGVCNKASDSSRRLFNCRQQK